MRRAVYLCVATLLTAAASPASAHGMRSAYLELHEAAPARYLATWRLAFPDARVHPRFPADCVGSDETRGAGGSTTSVLRCDQPLDGRDLAVDGLGTVTTEAVVRLERRDSSLLTQVLLPDAPSWRIPAAAAQRGWTVARAYVQLGLEHIAGGADHLLFLVALVLLVRRPARVLLAETAFTLSHSLSFSATALGVLHVPPAAAEACIALSLLLVAFDIQRRRASDDSLHAPLLALIFGFVHGLGFAGGLRDIGIPADGVLAALLGFGIGVELGQLIVLAVLLGALHLLRAGGVDRVARLGSVGIGCVGSYWFWQRLALCFS